MPIQIEWYDSEQTIILQAYIDFWTVIELQTVVSQTVSMLNSVDHPVYIITDFSLNKTKLVKMLHAANYFEKHLQMNYALGIIVGLDSYLKLVVKFANRVAPRLVKSLDYADTIEEALAIIAAHTNGDSSQNSS